MAFIPSTALSIPFKVLNIPGIFLALFAVATASAPPAAPPEPIVKADKAISSIIASDIIPAV